MRNFAYGAVVVALTLATVPVFAQTRGVTAGDSMRRALLKVHQWVGLSAAAFLFVIGITGSALVFENEIDRALNPGLSYVEPHGQPLALAELVARANAAQPNDPVSGIHIADTPDQAYELSSRIRRTIMMDPYTGRVLGTRDREKSFARFLHLLHTRLLAGAIGETIVGWASVLMLLLAVSGVVLWWPRGILTIGRAGSWKRTNFDLHNALGFYSSIVMVVMALSGVLIAFERTADPLVLKLNGGRTELDASRLQSSPTPGDQRITPDAAIAIAEQALPGAFASNVSIPGSPKAIYRIFKKFPEDRTPAGRSRVYVDQFSGHVLGVENTRTALPGRRIVNVKRSAHTGDIFGAPTQALYFLVSLGMGLQVVTGVLIWWNSRKPRRRHRASNESAA